LEIGERDADVLVALVSEREERGRVDRQDRPHGAVDRMSVARLGADGDQPARDEAHAHEVEVEEIVEVRAIPGGLVEPAGDVPLQVLRPIDVKLDALVRERGPQAPQSPVSCARFQKSVP
jgi:hypothetical protein